MTTAPAENTFTFQAEVSRLLEIVAHSLYSEREVFLRELIANASDACDRLRYEALTNPALQSDSADLKITLNYDKAARTLMVADNGIGMSRTELLENLGTIAKSGTGELLKKLADVRRDGPSSSAAAEAAAPSLIGQFGVGFYSAFMVADKVTVQSRRAGEAVGYVWTSDGKGTFTLEESDRAPARGTSITLQLKEGADEFTDEVRLKAIVTRYSDHIAFPIVIPGPDGLQKTLNTASALWQRNPKEITPEQYKEFYHHNGSAYDEPALTLHWHGEGVIEYRALLFVPMQKPFDLFDPQRRHKVKLYVRRVFITDAADGLLPPYLRFLRGVVDSEDLPLNVSREMLQNNPVLAKLKGSLTKRILGDLSKAAAGEQWPLIWDNFGAVLKEGIYEDKDHQALLLKLCRFHTTRTVAEAGAPISLETYLERIQPGQEAIYTITGKDQASLINSPQLEGFKAKNVEVLLLTDPVDDFWLPAVENYNGKPLRSVTRADAKLDSIKAADTPEAEAPAKEANQEDMTELMQLMKATLGQSVKDVRVSTRLTSSAVCLVAGENDIDINLERLLRQHKQLPEGLTRVLEINPSHPLIKQLAALTRAQSEAVGEMSWLLLDQARILEGEPLPDPVAFASRQAKMLELSLQSKAA
jgi:molecular chaperone HtpG